MMINSNELKVIARLTLELVKLRQNECKHLVIENISQEIFGKLLTEYEIHKQGKLRLGPEDTPLLWEVDTSAQQE